MTNDTCCPICRAVLPAFERYPDYLCRACAERAQSRDGRALRFTNASISGGVLAAYMDDGAPYASDRCWVDGIACRVREAKFGGLVFQPVETRPADASDTSRIG